MKILIDARLYGLENAGLGRYLIGLVDELSKQDNKNEYTILLRKKHFDGLDLPANWYKVKADFGHYGFIEQIKLPNIIKKVDPDLVHFPHLNVPVLFRGKFVVTIHDMLMHTQRGFNATTLNPLIYLIKRQVIKFVFDVAVKKSIAIIVPSKVVKKELIDYYHIEAEKINVIYEG